MATPEIIRPIAESFFGLGEVFVPGGPLGELDDEQLILCPAV